MRILRQILNDIYSVYKSFISLVSSVLNCLEKHSGFLTWVTLLIGAFAFITNTSFLTKDEHNNLREFEKEAKILRAKQILLNNEVILSASNKIKDLRTARSKVLNDIVTAYNSYENKRSRALFFLTLNRLYLEIVIYLSETGKDQYFAPAATTDLAAEHALRFYNVKPSDLNLKDEITKINDSIQQIPLYFSMQTTGLANELRNAFSQESLKLQERYLGISANLTADVFGDETIEKLNNLFLDYEVLPADESLGIFLPIISERMKEGALEVWPTESVWPKLRASMEKEIYTGFKMINLDGYIFHGPVSDWFPFSANRSIVLIAKLTENEKYEIVDLYESKNLGTMIDSDLTDDNFVFVMPIFSDVTDLSQTILQHDDFVGRKFELNTAR